MLTDEQRDFLFPRAYNAALRAGAAILEVYEHEAEYDISLKKDNSPITRADRRAHNIIKEYLAQTRIPLLSEEGREMLYDERRRWDLFWMVDPLDGTKEFIKGNGEFTVNIALLADNKPVMSVVYVPYIQKIYFSVREGEAWMKDGIKADSAAEFPMDIIFGNAQSLPVTKGLNKPIRIGISRSHNTEETFKYVEVLKKKYPDAEVVEQGSSYKFCLLAEGVLDIYVRTTNTYEWDTAAGEAVLRGSGGDVVSLPGFEPLEYNKLSLLNPNFVCRSRYMMEEKLLHDK